MADQPDSRTFLYAPGWIWDAIFKIVQLAVVAYFGNSAVETIKNNGEQQTKHAEAQIGKLDESIAKQDEVKAAVVENTAIAAASGPRQVDVNIQQINKERPSDAKAADEKPAESPPGT